MNAVVGNKEDKPYHLILRNSREENSQSSRCRHNLSEKRLTMLEICLWMEHSGRVWEAGGTGELDQRQASRVSK